MLCGLLHSAAPSHKRCCSRQVRKNKLPKLNESSFIVEYGSGELQKGNLFMEELSMHRTSQFANLYDHLTRQVTQHKGVPRLLDPVEPLALISRSDLRDDSQFVSPLHSLNQHRVQPWKWMVGIRSFPFGGLAYFQVLLLMEEIPNNHRLDV